jgi:hypothetical protein
MARQTKTLAQTFQTVSSDGGKKGENAINKPIKNDIKNDIKSNITNDIKNEGSKDIRNDNEYNINNKIKKDSSKNIKNNSKLENLLSGKEDKKKKPQYIYLEPEIVKLLDKYGGVKKKGRSSKKSELINEILKEFFRQRGDL